MERLPVGAWGALALHLKPTAYYFSSKAILLPEKEKRANPYVKGEIICINQIQFQVWAVPRCYLDPPCGRLTYFASIGSRVFLSWRQRKPGKLLATYTQNIHNVWDVNVWISLWRARRTDREAPEIVFWMVVEAAKLKFRLVNYF